MFCKSTPAACNKIIPDSDIVSIASNCNILQLARSHHPMYHTITHISYIFCFYDFKFNSQNVLHFFFVFLFFLVFTSSLIAVCSFSTVVCWSRPQSHFFLAGQPWHAPWQIDLFGCKPKQCRPPLRRGFQRTFWTAHVSTWEHVEHIAMLDRAPKNVNTLY